MNFDEPTDIYYLDGNYNIYDNTVSLWWGSQGSYISHLIERSTDGAIWEEVVSVPRFSTFINLEEEVDGEYFYRISAVSDEGTVLDTEEMTVTIRVKEGALIGQFYTYFDEHNNEVVLNWDLIKENVHSITIERKLLSEDDFELLGEFGSLKTIMYDNVSESGVYIYRITLFDTEGNELDSIESGELDIQLNS